MTIDWNISRFDSYGVATLTFSQPMKDVFHGFNLSTIDDTVIELELVTYKKESESRQLQENDLFETVNISNWAPISFYGSELRI